MKMHRVTVMVAAIVAVVFCAAVCGAEEGKFGFVDVQKLMGTSAKAKEMQKKLMQLLETKKTSLENKKKELIQLQEELQKQGPMLKEDTRNDKIKQIGIKEMEFKLAEKEAQNALQNEERDMMEALQRDITKIISKIRAEKKLTMVFNSMALLSADDALDLTEEVAKQYDAKAPAQPAPAPAAPAKPKAPGK
jgi:outer membrane protein